MHRIAQFFSLVIGIFHKQKAITKEWCGLKDDPNFVQCCCNCIHHLPVHYNCCTGPEPSEKEKQKANIAKSCVCSVRKGWACVPPGFGRIYDNWPEHSIGCELYTPKNDK